MQYRVIIIDDEVSGIQTLQFLIEKHLSMLKVIDTHSDPIKAIESININKPDILFLDINMPKMNGFDLLSKLEYHNFKLIFTTAHLHYAIKAVKIKADDFLLKPIDVEDLKNCANTIIETLKEEDLKDKKSKIIKLHQNKSVVILNIDNILFIEKNNDMCIFETNDGLNYTSSKDLIEFQQYLESHLNFIRINKNVIINTNFIITYQKGDSCLIKMQNGKEFEVSRRKKKDVLDLLKTL